MLNELRVKDPDTGEVREATKEELIALVKALLSGLMQLRATCRESTYITNQISPENWKSEEDKLKSEGLREGLNMVEEFIDYLLKALNINVTEVNDDYLN